jgi:hypothetical protein
MGKMLDPIQKWQHFGSFIYKRTYLLDYLLQMLVFHCDDNDITCFNLLGGNRHFYILYSCILFENNRQPSKLLIEFYFSHSTAKDEEP